MAIEIQAITKNKVREISGGGKVVVYGSSPDGLVTVACVSMSGERYPEQGKEAMNEGQCESVFISKGSFDGSYNGTQFHLESGDVIYFEEGVRYTLTGKGEAIVNVIQLNPEKNGETRLIAQR